MASFAPDARAVRYGAVERAARRTRTEAGWLSRAAPWLVFGLAAVLRLCSLDLAAFTYDDADVMLRARAVAAGQPTSVGALTSWGVPDPPLLIYLLAAVARLPSPALATLGLMALINALAVLATYSLAARFFGQRLGVLAGLLYAVNPWAIYFGRRAWSEVQPVLAVMALWAAFEVVVARRDRFALPFLAALVASVQARLVAASYAPAALVALALGGRLWLSRWSLAGLAGGGLLALPYLVYLVGSREQTAAALAEGNRGLSPIPRITVLQFAWWVAAGLNLLPTPARLAPWLDLMGAVLRAEAWLAGGLLLGGLAICLAQCARRRPSWERFALILAWTVLPLGLVAWQSSTIYLHYLVLLLPMLFLLMALPLEALLRARPPIAWLGAILFLGVALPQASAWLALQRTLAIYDTAETAETSPADRRLIGELSRESAQLIGTGEAYGVEVPLRIWLAAADRTRAELASSGPRELLVSTAGTNPLAEDRPAILESVLGPDLDPHYQPADSLVLPLGRPASLLVTGDVEPPIGPERLGPRKAFIPLPTTSRGSRDGIRLMDLPARSAGDWARTLGAVVHRSGDPARSVAFMAPDRVHSGESLEVVTLWPGPARGLRPAVALLDPGDQRVPERENPRRRPLDIGADRLLLTRHQVPVASRVAGGDYRLIVEAAPDGGLPERFELGTVGVVLR